MLGYIYKAVSQPAAKRTFSSSAPGNNENKHEVIFYRRLNEQIWHRTDFDYKQ